mmetsp:Transcript_22018/g.57463  ORF Transcript_22018/g.57463 Transcript_22018/m.57463 type:complete len:247 (-) Transcript_22018:156-896(-)
MLAVSTPASPTAPQRARMPQRTRLLAERKRVVRRVPVPRPLGGPRDGLCVGLAPGDVGDQSERRVAPGGHAARGEEELLPCAALFALDVLHPPRPQHPLHRGRSGLWPPRGQRALVRGRPPPVQRPRRAQQPRPRAHGEDGPRLRGGGHGLFSHSFRNSLPTSCRTPLPPGTRTTSGTSSSGSSAAASSPCGSPARAPWLSRCTLATLACPPSRTNLCVATQLGPAVPFRSCMQLERTGVSGCSAQ